jgi:hypothetical protein
MSISDHLNLAALQIFAQAVPDPKGGAALPGVEKLQTLMHWVFIVAGIVSVVGIVSIGAKMAISNRGHGAENPNIGALGIATAGCVVISVASAIVNLLLA